MNLFQYLLDKRFFILFYIGLMVFVSLMMLVSFSPKQAVGNLVYINAVSFLFASLYIITGYFYHRTFYKDLEALINREQEEVLAAFPEPKKYGQKLIFQLLKKLNKEQTAYIHKLHEEKRDHQDFIMSWIHEVKLPIAASRLLLENSAGKSVDYLTDKFEDELDKIDKYVVQALYYSRIDSFSKDYFITEIELGTILKDSVKKYSKLFISKRIRFTIFDGRRFIQSDRKWLSFILDQIVANSLMYTDEGGEISFSFDEDRQEKRLMIRDSGIGIKPEDIHRVFEKGFTGSTGRSHAKSTGMGLYLAKKLALKLGHDLTVQSTEDKYTIVTIHFPKIRNYYQL
ncbi:sensor histidine kinase [Pseudalkalibacillus salsuginis]|uniref:sensor histidine kinase n=1 Tax=Pseudalkalibacillus salsuginis TaxID=2910972 RepID=UPI001F2EEAC6|nr:sensor histidine kinase [Pseudalkalibacillus salsuginis]MCF6408176.1 sensor histidine kinase [Pseudalkalibacillus salsuginis]